jgi:hypothetical protein
MLPEPDMETVIRIGWTVTILGFIVTVVSIVGELRGWWNFVGEVGATTGAIVTVVVGMATLLAGAGRQQVGGVRDAVETNGRKLDNLDRLDVIEDALVEADGRTSKLDAVQVELDRQTGVLDRQVEILERIRDGLDGA